MPSMNKLPYMRAGVTHQMHKTGARVPIRKLAMVERPSRYSSQAIKVLTARRGITGPRPNKRPSA